jgi:hypothetical protein
MRLSRLPFSPASMILTSPYTSAKTARRSALQYRAAYSPEGAPKRYLPVG